MFNEETLIIVIVAGIALAGMFYLGSVELSNLVVGGLLGYLTKSVAGSGE